MKNWRLITYNIHKGATPFRNMNAIERLRVALKEVKADFLILQEIVGEREGKRAEVERQLESLADARWPYHAYGKNAVFPKRNHGNAILSAVPIEDYHNKDLTIYPIERRGLLHCRLQMGKTRVHLCSVHLDLLEITRSKQISKMVDYLRHIPINEPLILGGDFNDWAMKAGEALIDKLHLEERSARTFPSWLPLLPLDRLYIRGVHIQKFSALSEFPWNRLSDHLPLLLEFRLK